MLKEKMLSISIFCLSISIIISSVVIAKGLEKNGNYIGSGMYNMSSQLSESIHNANYQNIQNEKAIMNLDSAATYLGLSVNDLVEVIHTEGIGFPYVKVGSDFIINKNALDKWLETARIEIK